MDTVILKKVIKAPPSQTSQNQAWNANDTPASMIGMLLLIRFELTVNSKIVNS